MTDLSVNLNVAALLRNRREHPWPDLIGLARIALNAGAAGVTVHPRPDERHTRPDDVRGLRSMLDAEFPDWELNVKGYPDERFLSLVQQVRADQVTLVPDDPGQATSDHGWDFPAQGAMLADVVAGLQANGHRVSLFCDPEAAHMPHAAMTGTDRVELYTGPFGGSYDDPVAETQELDRLAAAATAAAAQGLKVNAGHDLTVSGTRKLIARIPSIAEVSIGHALFCDALNFGMTETVRRYLEVCSIPQADDLWAETV
ncbi:pyridoxine 5'-phosphate synthase [Ruegeria arenilitoris]|uniref:pyridoxine 5'-phosphate synthase n=1 Tax=Ruegeria arenilitoris TaxID=1173585 RepID=UPI00157FEC84|nr:pyridoxine 5'-phosphate synthase [Ruegeria arenilitoris]